MRNMRMNPIAGALLLVLGLSACERRERVLGTIVYYTNDTAPVVVPDTVARAAAFPVRVTTYAGSCFEAGPTVVEVAGLRATVTPYDYEVEGWPWGCDTDELQVFTHSAQVSFAQAGVATVVVRGLRKPEHDTITVTRTVVIR